MKQWEQRPKEIAYLLNPAFCGEVIRRCVVTYIDKINQPFPYSLSFLILPLILNSFSRDELPTSSRLHFHDWINEHKHVLIGFSERARNLVPVTKEALIFLLQTGTLKIDGSAGLIKAKDIKKTHSDRLDEEHCFRRADLLGKMFARVNDEKLIYSLMGVKP